MKIINLKQINRSIKANVGGDNRPIGDPFSDGKFLSAERIARDSKYLPVILIKHEAGSYSLLFLIENSQEHLILWTLDKDLSYKAQKTITANEVAEFFCFNKSAPSVSWQSLKNIDTFWRPKIKSFVNSLSKIRLEKFSEFQFNGSFRAIENCQGLWVDIQSVRTNLTATAEELSSSLKMVAISDEVADLTEKAWRKLVTPTNALREYLNLDTSSWDSLHVRGYRFFIELYRSWLISAFKDSFLLFNRHNICFSPVSNKWVLSEKSIMVSDRDRTYRLCLYRDRHIEFIEIKDIGFINSTSGFIFPFESLGGVRVSSVDNPSTWFTGNQVDQVFWNKSITQLYESQPESEKTSFVLVNNCSNWNLGHFLWNDLSGIVLFSEMVRESGKDIPYAIGWPSDPGNNFSNLSYAEIGRKYLGRVAEFDQTPVINTVEQSEILAEGIPICFRNLFLSDSLIKSYNSFFSSVIDSDDSLNLGKTILQKHLDKRCVFFNVRTHNKSLLNTEGCISELINSIKAQGLDDVCFLFEGSSDASGTIATLANLARGNGIPAEELIDINVFELYSVISGISMAVIPVGSGLVFPTWVLDKPCLVHADPGHLCQLAFWSVVTQKDHCIHEFHPDEIQTVSDEFYSSYNIAPEVFSSRVMNLLVEITAGKSN